MSSFVGLGAWELSAAYALRKTAEAEAGQEALR